MAAPRLFLIDTFGLIFRAYHARARSAAPPMRTTSGLPTEVTFIFNNMIKKMLATHQPDYVAAVFESLGPTFREQAYAEYKANRPEAPPDLLQQIPYVRRLLAAMCIPILEYAGFEADDVIGAIARGAAGHGVEVVIVSSDKDLLQLVTGRVTMLNPAKNDTVYDEAAVEEFLGVRPDQVADWLALMGDSIDNIPGAPGIGDKGAQNLLAEFDTLENLLDNAAQVKRNAYRESLLQHREQIELSKRLATIDTTVPVDWSLDALAAKLPDTESLRALYNELEFFSQVRELGDGTESKTDSDLRLISSPPDWDAWLATLDGAVPLAVAVAPDSEAGLGAPILGLSARSGEGRGVTAELLDHARPLLESADHQKTGHDLKAVQVALARRGIQLRGQRDDLLLYAFLLTADPGACSPDAICSKYLDRKGCGLPEEQAAHWFLLTGRLRDEVETRGLRSVYDTIDLPLTGVLARMEQNGIRIDPAALAEMSRVMQREIERLSGVIYEMAGRPFNISSPQQLGKVLYEEMGVPAPGRPGKTKSLSTAAEILEGLAGEYPITARVLEFRQLTKLKGTYVDALPALIRPETGRLHTTFNPAGAATGRLSSSNPNLQNIPIRTEMGRQIRAAFVPEPGWKLVIADYSQIELRLLAHFSRDPVLVHSFRNGEDIHTRTAAEVFGVAPLMVTPEHRRNAKAVNFGIVYGLSAFGLAGQLGISRTEAESYIRGYFERYAGVKKFIDQTIAAVRKSGYTKTLFGRERPIPDMHSRNPNARGFAERTAVNTPLQGTAADLIKLAMIRIDGLLAESKMRARMLLQVHDELVFEAPPEEAAGLAVMVKHEMESVYRLEVPLIVDTGIGDNWRDAK